MESVGELATLFPTAGSFPHFATRFVDPALGFTLAISYGYCYTIAIASEVSAAAIIVVSRTRKCLFFSLIHCSLIGLILLPRS